MQEGLFDPSRNSLSLIEKDFPPGVMLWTKFRAARVSGWSVVIFDAVLLEAPYQKGIMNFWGESFIRS